MESEHKTSHQVSRLLSSIKDLQNALRISSQMEVNSRPHLASMTSMQEIPENDPYSRILANNDRDVVSDIERIQSMGAAVIGLNGIGALISESLCRTGIGRLLLMDGMEIENSDLDRMHYLCDDIGYTRTEQMEALLHTVNPDTIVAVADAHAFRIDPKKEAERALRLNVSTTPTNINSAHLRQSHGLFELTDDLKNAINKKLLHVVFLCVQNPDLALFLNDLCLELDILFVYCFVGLNGISGDVISVAPGISSCLHCFEKRKIIKHPDLSESHEGRTFPCLPTSDCILAGLCVQNSLMYLLKYGSFCSRLEFDGLIEDISRTELLVPLLHCTNVHCRRRTQEEEN